MQIFLFQVFRSYTLDNLAINVALIFHVKITNREILKRVLKPNEYQLYQSQNTALTVSITT